MPKQPGQLKIEKRLAQIEADLTLLQAALCKQLVLHWRMRDHELMRFLREEYERKKILASELCWILGKNRLSSKEYGDETPILHGKQQRIVNNTPVSIHINGGAGDVLCLTPSLEAIKSQYKGVDITVLCNSPLYVELFKHNPHIDHLKLSGDKATDNAAHKAYSNAQPVFFRLSLGGLGTDIHYRIPAARILAKGLGVEIASDTPAIYLTDSEKAQAREYISTYLVDEQKKLVVVNPISRQPSNQNWPIERWSALADQFPDVVFAQLGLPDEPLVKGMLDWRMQGEMRLSLALLASANAYVGMDTFWNHAAAALNTPGVVVFGGTRPEVFGHSLHSNMFKFMSCSPCHHRLSNRDCPYGTRCVMDISIAEMAAALTIQLSL